MENHLIRNVQKLSKERVQREAPGGRIIPRAAKPRLLRRLGGRG